MQWDTDGLLVWLTTTSISIIDLERAILKQMSCLGLIGRKMTRHFQMIPFRLLLFATLTGQGNDYIESIPCSPQTIDSFTSSIHDNAQVICKSITTLEIEADSDSSSSPDPSWNPKCMTMSDWVKIQAEDQGISNLIQWYKGKGLHKGKDTDSPRDEAIP